MEDLGSMRLGKEMWDQVHTSLTFRRSPPGYILRRLTRTFEPSKVPSYTHPRRDSERVHDFGSTSFMPQIFPSSYSDSWNGVLAWPGVSTRT